jgi:ketosteroid isomerase-like protein
MKQSDHEEDVLALLGELAKAELAGDTEFYERVADGDFVAIGPLGFVLTREQWLGRFRSGAYKCSRYDLSDIKLLDKGAVAIVVAKADIEATFEGRPSPVPETRVLHVFQRSAEGWKLLSLQHSGIARPPRG